MIKQKILRLGICACATRFHHRFEKQTITVNGITLHIQEVIIAEGDHRQAIRALRAHFFLDAHKYYNRAWSTDILRIELKPNRKGGERVYFGSSNYRKKWKNRCYWSSTYLPRSQRILNAIQTILATMNRHEFKQWLAHMA